MSICSIVFLADDDGFDLLNCQIEAQGRWSWKEAVEESCKGSEQAEEAS